MSDTPRDADKSQEILNDNWSITLFRNSLSTYTAKARHIDGREEITDDFTPSQTLYRLTEKISGRIV